MSGSDYTSVAICCGYDMSGSVTEILEIFATCSVSILAPDNDNRTTVTALYEPGSLDLELLFSELEPLAQEDDQFRIKQEIVRDRDWVRDSQNGFKPILISGRLRICAPWHETDASSTNSLIINPGLSFGTGHHATTRMCIEFLTERVLYDCEIVDFGCGSGILALSALKLGSRFAWGIDTDCVALDESTDNADLNNLGFKFIAVHPDDFLSDVQPDVVLANLHLDALLELSETLKSLVYDDGWLAMSGVLRSQVKPVVHEYEDTFDLNVRHDDDWALISGRKKTQTT
ncbi:MAG: 50S ribosomal protein L11 methyltransferase [Acidiferrobacterales bacterium]|nr:50S ribosomal protein L11 methyltransferase [Acidiferrobacterales bacterium]